MCVRLVWHPQSARRANRMVVSRLSNVTVIVVFVHMTHDIRHAELEARLPPGMNLGYDGMTLD